MKPLSFLLGTLFATAIFAEGADPFRLKWREEKEVALDILNRMNSSYLLPSTPQDVLTYATDQQLADLATELKQSPVEFTEITPTNPEGHNPGNLCLHTDAVSASALTLSKTDCGETSRPEMRKALIKGAILHLGGVNDELADYITIAIVDSYEGRAHSDASIALYDRYKEPGTNGVVLNLDLANRKVTGFSNLNLSSLPPLRGQNNYFRSQGNYSSFNCRSWYEGIGRDGKGGIGYGELEGTSRNSAVSLDATVSIQVLGHSRRIQIEGTYEVARGGTCHTDTKTFSYTMDYYPPTAQEIETARITGNTAALFAILRKDPGQITAAEIQEAEQLLQSGVRPDSSAETFKLAIRLQAWNLAATAASSLPAATQFSDVLFTLIQGKQFTQMDRVLTTAELRKRLDLNAFQNHYSALGVLLNDLHKDPANLEQNEGPTAAALRTLFAIGFNPLAGITKISNVPQTALANAVSHFKTSPKVVAEILQKMDTAAVTAIDGRGRTSVDYLTVYWNFFKNNCKPSAGASPRAQAEYVNRIDRFNDVYRQILAKGHNGARKGCVYFRTNVRRPACTWTEKTGAYNINFATDYETREWNQRTSGFRSSDSPESCG